MLGEDKREMREDESEGEERRGGDLRVGGDETRRRDSQRHKLLLRQAEERKSEISQAF